MNSLINRTLVIRFLAGATGHAHAQDLDCPGEVSLNGGSIEVEASDSGDDTDNIQCALMLQLTAVIAMYFWSRASTALDPSRLLDLWVICVVQARSEPA